MKAKKPTEKMARKRTSDEFKDQALKRAEQDGVALVARDLGIAKTQITAWWRKRQIEGAVTEKERLKEAELARLKRDMARLEEENAFLKKPRRTSQRDTRSEVRPESRATKRTTRSPSCAACCRSPAAAITMGGTVLLHRAYRPTRAF